MRRASHPHDDRLYECYLALRQGETADPPTAEHLADCDSCAARYAEIAAFMDTVRTDGDADTDTVFTPERLQAQQKQVARRLETVGRPARVLSFPGRVVQGTIRASTMRSPKWTAAAAAAGLFLGIALGASYEWDWQPRQATTPLAARARVTPVLDNAADEAFMSELDMAIDRPRTRELAAFDAFTPHFREIRDQR